MSALACTRCDMAGAVALCCTGHGKQLCHRCYRVTHFVEICSPSCPDCAREGLNPAAAVGDRPPGFRLPGGGSDV